jgi:adenine-specific DNA-methyltransferase
MKRNSSSDRHDSITKVAELFPHCATERRAEDGTITLAIDFDLLRQELSPHIVEGPQERYQLTWPGKREALLAAHVPITKTLRPCREESVDFDTTRNLFIEGDNLESLKLLQEIYLSTIDVIYIDPPYNTGNDFIYKDDFRDSVDTYLIQSRQKSSGGKRLVGDTESSGRFHSQWLSMMFSRLRLARNLLAEGGVIFLSIDDHEQANLKRLCDEVFGESNFVGQFKWNRVAKAPSLSDTIRTKYEYVLCYKRGDVRKFFGKKSYNVQAPVWHNPNKQRELLFPAQSIMIPRSFEKGTSSPKYQVELVDDLIEESGFNKSPVRIKACSAWSQNKINRYLDEGNVFQIKKEIGTLYSFIPQSNDAYIAPSDLLSKAENGVETNTEASAELQALGLAFSNPKPVSLIKYLVQMVTYGSPDAIVMDFFAGSSTTAHAVMQLNAEDGGTRTFIMVQTPEPCSQSSGASKTLLRETPFTHISDISKERIRRAGKKIQDELGLQGRSGDVGFRVLKVDTPTLGDVSRRPEALTQDDLFTQVETLREGRSCEDLLFQVLLDSGIDLRLPITERILAGKRVHFVEGSALAACFDSDISEEVVRILAEHKPMRAVFRDAGFGNDTVKVTVGRIFNQLSPDTKITVI